MISIPYEELESSPREQMGIEGFSATRRLKCAWDKRLKLAKQLLGANTVLNSTGSGEPYPSYTAAKVVSVDINPFDERNPAASDDDRDAAYTSAVLTVEYRTEEQIEQVGDQLVSEDLDVVTEFLTLPGDELFWDDAQAEQVGIDASPGLQVKMLAWRYTRHQLTSIGTNIANMVGSVNSSSVSSPTLGVSFNQEALLYDGLTIKRTVTTNGVSSLDATLTFINRPTGWNNFFNVKTQEWGAIYNASGEQVKPYTTANFQKIIL